jgi:hypothetical protein
MSSFQPSPLLRKALIADAVVSGATGLLMLAGAGLFARLLDLPEELVRYAGLVLLPFAAWVAYLALQDRPPRPAVWAVVAVNALWATDSLLLLASGWVAPNGLGVAFVVGQAAVVGALAATQAAGARASSPRLAAT